VKGKHLIAELHHCHGALQCLSDASRLRRHCLDAVSRAGLTIVGDVFHQFDGGGVTGAVILAESHLAVHTWPELGSVTLDVFVCNHANDNGGKAHAVLEDLLALFVPGDVVTREV
jgi:S-adenosylmethionine decarboxylase proenzyme